MSNDNLLSRITVDAETCHGKPCVGAVLAERGHDAKHTLDLPTGNTTKNRIVNQLSFDEQRVFVPKDTDFFYALVARASVNVAVGENRDHLAACSPRGTRITPAPFRTAYAPRNRSRSWKPRPWPTGSGAPRDSTAVTGGPAPGETSDLAPPPPLPPLPGATPAP
jgi:hypothetical protein